ncbi:glycoside hydrolase [Coprinopsis marcescibilis]|uniref:lytic cellulose monooxygenase (C4-dehydrogenating) n=1 Tax=Coprinopsis marcescibilis TaxID=230819 RepID=A0A5C3KNJ2_COPMA|nr:glycoside hydrolase [Coprinopsis marcescibilis]
MLIHLVFPVGLFAVGVSGHGFVREVRLGEVSYEGYHPYVDPYTIPTPQRIIRKVPWIGPVEDLSLIDVQCNGQTSENYFTEPAPLVGTVVAGDTVSFNWISYAASDSHHGPMVTYMAKVPPGQDVRKWNPGSDAVWFKIEHSGKDAQRRWAATHNLLQPTGSGDYTVRIPPKLQPGQYLIRHEWIALHLAHAYPGAQVYPICVQVEVTGNGTAFPTSFVSFPGEYHAKTPGV